MIPPEAYSQLQFHARDQAQRAMFDELAGVYRRNDVLRGDGYASALVESCPDRGGCWKGCDGRASRRACVHGLPGDDGSIFFPWVGMNYRSGGVCVAGWNLHNRGADRFPLTEEHVIARASQTKLADGHHRVWGSLFAFRSMSAAAAVHDALRGAAPVDARRPQDLVGYFNDIARVQVVKCAPLGERSNASQEMNANCPPRFLLPELEILKPRVLIVFGVAAKEAALRAIRMIDTVEPHWPHKTSSGYGRRESRVTWGPLDVLTMWHPTYARWPHALKTLVGDLAARPLANSSESPR